MPSPRDCPGHPAAAFLLSLFLGGAVLGGCKNGDGPPGGSPYAPFVGTWFAGVDTPISYQPDMPARWGESVGGAWIRIDEDGGVRLGASYELHMVAQIRLQYADERSGRLEVSDGGARIFWAWEDVYESSYVIGVGCPQGRADLTQLSPDASVLDSAPLIKRLPDGGTMLDIVLVLDYGLAPQSINGFVPVPDLGPERHLTLTDLSGAWSNSLPPGYSLDGGALPNPYPPFCYDPSTRLEVQNDAGLHWKELSSFLGSGDVQATYVLTDRTGQLVLEGRRVVLSISSVTIQSLVLHVDGSTELSEVTDAGSEQYEKRAWFSAPDQLFLTDLPHVPLSRASP